MKRLARVTWRVRGGVSTGHLATPQDLILTFYRFTVYRNSDRNFRMQRERNFMEEGKFEEGSNFKDKIRKKKRESLSYFPIAIVGDKKQKTLFALLTYLGLLFYFFRIFFFGW